MPCPGPFHFSHSVDYIVNVSVISIIIYSVFFYSVLLVSCMNNNTIYYYYYPPPPPTHSGSVSQFMHSILWKVL